MPKPNRYALILAGGRGTRFWPKSRTKTPKQLLPFLGERSLLQETYDRLLPLVPAERIWILTNEHLQKAIRKQLPDVPAAQVLAEPEQRNTAPCLGLAAQIIQGQDPNALLGIFPADHYIARPAPFRKFVQAAFKAAENGQLVTLGIQPRWAETGYGYLQFPDGAEAGELHPVGFREKPDLATATGFVESGHFYWNAGMFFWRAAAFLDEMRANLPKTFSLLSGLPAFGSRNFFAQLKKTYPKCENVSVDYGIMEKAAIKGKVVGLATGDFGWNDLGSWNAVYELAPHDANGNVLRADAQTYNSTGSYVETQKPVALVGVKDLVIIETPDALLIADRHSSQDVGQIVKLLERQKRLGLL